MALLLYHTWASMGQTCVRSLGYSLITRMGQNLGLFIAQDFASYFFPPKAKEKT